MCGSQSETQIPLWPCCFHFRCEARSGARPSPIGVITGLKLGGSGLPASRLSSGLGSNVSMWLGPPSMNRKMTLRAVAGRRQGAAAGEPDVVGSGPAARSRDSRSMSARPPKPAPALQQPLATRRRPGSMRTLRAGRPSSAEFSSSAFRVSVQGIPASPSQRTGTHWN